MMFVSFKKFLLTLFVLLIMDKFKCKLEGAIVAPPWANPKLNPCAFHPMGWQMLYWPPDGTCYKIFQMGHPCPEDMELTPSVTNSKAENLTAECRCPPKTAEYAKDGHCYEIFTAGPCMEGFYFSPDLNTKGNRKYGTCKELQECPDGFIFWPLDNTCYKKLTRGPCSRGLLLTEHNKLPACRCGKDKELKEYRYENGKCYQHFTKGPCQEKGSLFLTNQICGCHNFLPHYHQDTRSCYELDTIGPCNKGEIFKVKSNDYTAKCHCKDDYVRYLNSSNCYRPFTQGPCPDRHFLVNKTDCIKQPCQRGYLYFNEDQKCHRIGTKGPCPDGKIVTFDFRTRPSIDGISYNGLCVCETENCVSNNEINCVKGWIKYKGKCHKLYTQNACQTGAWLVPHRGSLGKEATCECLPGYNKQLNECTPPIVIIAEYLNRTYRSTVLRSITIKVN